MTQVSFRATTGAVALLAVALAAWPTTARAACEGPLGEVTGDGVTNVTDVQCVILDVLAHAQGTAAPACLGGSADLDCSAAVDVSDVQLAIGAALHLPLAPSVDANHDACPDACQPDPTAVGAAMPDWQLEDFQPQSDGFGTTYGLEAFEDKVTVVALLASW